MSKYVEVTLSEYERYHYVPYWGHRRWIEAIEKGLKPKHGLEEEEGLSAHVWGVCGELAYAKARGIFYEPTINTFKAPDVGDVQVRCRTNHEWDLIIRRADHDAEFFVLVTVDPKRSTRLRVYDGGYWGWEAKQHKEWYRTYKKGRPKAWFVPQWALREREKARVVPFWVKGKGRGA